MRKALVVGVDYYERGGGLHGCVNDANAVKNVLERNGDGTLNFTVKLLTAARAADAVSRTTLREHVRDLFAGDSEIALLYFAGHGHIEATGGYLLPSDAAEGDDGVALSDVLTYASNSAARNKVILLDSCHSGFAGARPSNPNTAEIKEGTTILTASTAEQYAVEENGGGLFTTLLVDALSGAACNLLGEVTPGSVYAHIDQSLGPWDQRPVFKTNVKNFVSLRKVQPPISLGDLQRIIELFPQPGSEYGLDPTYEPEREPGRFALPEPNPANVATFALLQRLNRVNLVVPVGAPHMWHAAMQSKACKLTVLGEHYRRLVARKRI